MKLSVKPLSNVGVEVLNFDIEAMHENGVADQLRALWYEHGMLLFRNQNIDPHSQIEFSRLFGPLEKHPLKTTRSEEFPELFKLVNGDEKDDFVSAKYDGETIIGRLDWHIDLQYTGKPNHGAVLTAVEVAAEDGMTGFGDLEKAYAALDDKTKALIEQLELVYTFVMQRKHWRFVDTANYEPNPRGPRKPADVQFPDYGEVAYPIALAHPVTKRKVLTVVEQFLDRVVDPKKAGISFDESIDLLYLLVEQTRKSEFHYFHDWKEGDMVLWDNWRFMHCATGTKKGVRRVIHRTTIEGDKTLGRQLAQ